MRSLRRTQSFFAAISFAVALTGCRSSSSPETSSSTGSTRIQVTKNQSTSDWKINIVEVAEPETVMVQSGLSTADEKPKQNEKWLLLTLELTPPAANSTLPIKQIKLVDESAGARTPLSLTAKSETERPRFTYFEESFGPDLLGQSRAGQGSVDKDGKLVWMYTQDKKTMDVVLTVMKTEPHRILFLFSIPASAKRLSLLV